MTYASVVAFSIGFGIFVLLMIVLAVYVIRFSQRLNRRDKP